MADKELLDRLNSRSPFNEYNGITVKDLGRDWAVVEGEISPNMLNPWGTAHGGFIYSLCDVAAGVAATELASRTCMTLSGSIYYLRPSVGTYLRAEGKVIKAGRTVVVVETNVYNSEGVHTARGEFQVFLTDGR